MPRKKYRFLLTALNAYGPVNATLGFGELLARHGHHVTFTHLKKFRKAAEARNFEFIPFSEGFIKNDDSLVNKLDDNFDSFRTDPLERIKNYSDLDKQRLALLVNDFRKLDLILRKIVAVHQHSFDAFVHDWCDLTGSLFATNHPVISLQSANPLLLYHNGPPYSFGLSTKSDPTLWEEITEIFMEVNSINIEKTNAMLAEFNRPPVYSPLRLVLPVKSIGFYHYPAILDYEECLPKEPDWHRIDCFVRSADPEPIAVPQDFLDKPGKLIYFSLGSIASNDLKLMNEIISILAKSPHKFIISKGFSGDFLELADNMWGENYFDQIQVLQLVDLVITHGGNNSLMEILYYAKPLIVIPYFFDQYDNAQRVVDKNIGYRINLWELTQERLLDCIEKTLEDVDMHNRIKEISQSMKDSDSGTQAVEMIERIIDEAKAAKPSLRLPNL